jgi:hypothetical protein
MPLRTLNNPADILTVMGIIKSVLAVDLSTMQSNTRIGDIMATTSKDLIYVQQLYEMLQGPMPAVFIKAGPQKYRLKGRVERVGQTQISIRYYDSWDEQPNTLDNIKLNNMTDLMRIHANIESNDTLTFQGKNYAMSIPEMVLSGYDGAIDNTTIAGKSFVRHDLDLLLEILPYLCQ